MASRLRACIATAFFPFSRLLFPVSFLIFVIDRRRSAVNASHRNQIIAKVEDEIRAGTFSAVHVKPPIDTMVSQAQIDTRPQADPWAKAMADKVVAAIREPEAR